ELSAQAQTVKATVEELIALVGGKSVGSGKRSEVHQKEGPSHRRRGGTKIAHPERKPRTQPGFRSKQARVSSGKLGRQDTGFEGVTATDDDNLNDF
ncbi:MAG: hypothetical protein JXQ75_13390, partial [Phycisphaerae bacterium]|nr:hypothetical protein [Phycisphaerae bacterium]